MIKSELLFPSGGLFKELGVSVGSKSVSARAVAASLLGRPYVTSIEVAPLLSIEPQFRLRKWADTQITLGFRP